MFEGPVTGNIPEVLDNGEVTDGTHVTAGQLALALTPYAQATDLAVNTAASGNNAAAIQSLDDRVTAELASKRLLPRRRPWPPRTAKWPRTEAASPRCTGLSNKADQSAFDVLEGVVATPNNNATLATVAANYGLKTVVDQHSPDIAARWTPRWPTLSWGSRAEDGLHLGAARPPRRTPSALTA